MRCLQYALSVLSLVSSSVLAASEIHSHSRKPYDGQFIEVNNTNSAVEWWYAQALGAPVANGVTSSFQILFNLGALVAVGPRDPAAPLYTLAITGFFSNGTAFEVTLAAENATVTSGHGEEVTGTWGSIARFHASRDLKTFDMKFTHPQISGTVVFKANNAPHYACNSTSSPTFTSVSKGLTLSESEEVLFNQLGWIATTPGSAAKVDLTVKGAPLKFVGNGYHDHNFTPLPINALVSSWYCGNARVGPYDMSFVLVKPRDNSTNILTTGYLSRNGVVLQNQCSINGTKSRDFSLTTPYGAKTEAGVVVPEGYIVDYVLHNGEKFSFNLTSYDANPKRASYLRWVGNIVGGSVSKGEKFTGATMLELISFP
ncbi:hypothetical protein BXZ70DRAFT_1012718 [Cristinia sonorae]|uniref:Uncharacterized protein n=1 Tax=Cristinia sonorae TaxID=1940300 RepID=A0A8K0UF06_9AGAR|nr:hypothetical protein BXZ70DRAFT_1012718 [Cristinia sonorae]